MKTGDVVKLKPGLEISDVYYGFGVIIIVDEYKSSGFWCHVQWAHQDQWHLPGDLELISENR